MKKILNICLMMLCVAAFAACSSSDDEPLGELKIVKSDTNLTSVGGQASIQFSASAGTVTATSDADWCKVSEVTDTEVKLVVDPNTDYVGRNALITLSDGMTKQNVSLIQAGAVLVYDRGEQWQHVGNEASEIEVELYGSFSCQVTIPEYAKSWLSSKPSEDGKKLIFKAEENTDGTPRGCIAKVVSGDRTLEYEIYQYDVENITGSWKGQYDSALDGKGHGLSNVAIAGPLANGYYTITGLIDGLAIPVAAIYSDGIFAVPVQYVGQLAQSQFLYFGLLDPETQIYWTSNQFIGLVPMVLEDGTFILNFTDAGGLQGAQAAGFLFGVFPTKSTSGEADGYIEAYLNCLLYKG